MIRKGLPFLPQFSLSVWKIRNIGAYQETKSTTKYLFTMLQSHHHTFLNKNMQIKLRIKSVKIEFINGSEETGIRNSLCPQIIIHEKDALLPTVRLIHSLLVDF